jgi:glycosyltransferase involved in cell wall biosynthesis
MRSVVISIIIPTYHRPKLLARALRSIKSQCYQDWQVIVADDGDGKGWETALHFQDDRITAFLNAGRGQTVARNTALERANGEIVTYLDDDDWWEDPWHLNHIAQALRQDNVLAYCGGWLVLEDDEHEQKRLTYRLVASAEGLRHDNTLLISAVAYRRALHQQLGLFDPAVGHYFDWDWYLRLTNAGIGLQHMPNSSVCISVRLDGQSQSNESGPHNQAARCRDLATLSQKHGLVDIELKNHYSLLLEQLGHGK